MVGEEPYHRTAAERAYLQTTNEHGLLHRYLGNQLLPQAIFPIRSEDGGTRILEVSGQPSLHTVFLTLTFPQATVETAWPADGSFDFILVSVGLGREVAPSVDSIGTFLSSLVLYGELWLVAPMRQGSVEIIDHMRPLFCRQPTPVRRTFWDYVREIKPGLSPCIRYQIETLPSSLLQINFGQPSDQDKLRLEWILGLSEPLDRQSAEFRAHLAALQLGNGQRIPQPTGILRLRRVC